MRSGLHEAFCASLQAAQIEFCELGGVQANPDVQLVRQGIELARREGCELVLAVGGGSVIDSAKAIALGCHYEGDVWEVYAHKRAPETPILPVATILTLPAAGSENSINSVINNNELGRKLGYGEERLRPLLSLICPELFLTLPPEQLAYGACDMFAHVIERYFSPTAETAFSDELGEATMRSIIEQSRRVKAEPTHVEAWGQLALAGTIAHNNLLGIGREQSWACHALEHEMSAACPQIAHGAGLAVLIPAYMEMVAAAAPERFSRWAARVMGEPTIEAGIAALRQWFAQLGLPRNMQELGMPESTDYHTLASQAIAVRQGPLAGVLALDVAACTQLYHNCR